MSCKRLLCPESRVLSTRLFLCFLTSISQAGSSAVESCYWLQSGASEHGNDFAFEFASLDGSEGAAVFGAGAVVAEDEVFVGGEGQRVADVGVVLRGAVVNVVFDDAAVVDDEAGVVGDLDGVAALGDNAPGVGLAVLLEDDDVIGDVAIFEAVVEEQVAGADAGLHVVVGHGPHAEHHAEEHVKHDDHGGQPQEEALDFPDLAFPLFPGLLGLFALGLAFRVLLSPLF